MPWEGRANVNAALVLALIDQGVGGLLTDMPDFSQAVYDLRCPNDR